MNSFEMAQNVAANQNSPAPLGETVKSEELLENQWEMNLFEDNSGFCVMCEIKCTNISEHLAVDHCKNKIYAVKLFSGKQIMVINGVLDEELEECPHCGGIFYPNRVAAHGCEASGNDPNVFYEGMGNGYCLMCQFRCGDIKNHWRSVHNTNSIYRLDDVDGISVLHPKGTFEPADLNFTKDCQCGFCQRITYKHRRQRICEKKKMLMEQML
ncbi:Hypothetical predicted protein [Cloeon dipterum]|uniref:Uncharacterized protein n=1 Tax=Cloeon dipterum TaxID=197152 RepID=A0A8S1EBF1_9INSE|nr:Hypothetical predicted protein [Cloeon dipterum]